MGTLYDQDIAAWAQEQAALLRDRQWDQLDVEHLADEVAGLALHERYELAERLSLLLYYLLKWHCFPARRGPSWAKTVLDQRKHIVRMLERVPSLEQVTGDAKWQDQVWNDVRDKAVHEADLDYETLPSAWPWPFEQVLSQDFFP